jgi:hypothetical protein
MTQMTRDEIRKDMAAQNIGACLGAGYRSSAAMAKMNGQAVALTADVPPEAWRIRQSDGPCQGCQLHSGQAHGNDKGYPSVHSSPS